MSRFDYSDPGTDPAYCNPLDATRDEHGQLIEDEPADGEPWPSEIGLPETPIDPAEHACHAALDALATLEKALVDASTSQRVIMLRRMAHELYRSADRIALAATAKLDRLS